MKGTTKLNTLTNIVYILTDVLETNLMDMEAAYRREGYGLRHDVKRQYNAAIHAIRRLKADINKCSAGEQESFGNDADMVNALLLMLLDRVGDDDPLAFKFFCYIKSFPSKLGLDLQVDGAFAHLFDNQKQVSVMKTKEDYAREYAGSTPMVLSGEYVKSQDLVKY